MLEVEKQQPHWPALFKEIITHDAQKLHVFTQPIIPFGEATSLLKRHRELRRAAEEMLRWNTDKGKAK